MVSYKSVDLIGPTFKLLIEGFLKFIVTFPLSRFLVSCFFGREVGFRGALCIISSHLVITQSILSVVAFYVDKFVGATKCSRFGVFPGVGVPTTTKRKNDNYMLRGKVYFSTSRCIQDLVDNNNLKNPKVNLNPNWITGFTDGEGSFMISIIKSKDRALG